MASSKNSFGGSKNSFAVPAQAAPISSSTAIDKMLIIAKERYLSALKNYVIWNMNYEKEMSPITSFWKLLEQSVQKITNMTDIPFTNGLSKHDLRTITQQYLTKEKIPKILDNIYLSYT